MSTPYIGEIRLFAFSRTPEGWQPCDGRLLSIADHDTLFALIGTTYGGDGMRTFGMPDMRGQVPLHQGNGPGVSPRPLGQSGGSESVTITSGQVGSHTHPFQVVAALADSLAPGSDRELGTIGGGDTTYGTEVGGASFSAAAESISMTGGNKSHANLMPTLTVSFCMASDGIFPSQS
jgi:microcystin-dependent protein